MGILSILKSNLRSKKGNFISILVLIFIISLSLTTIISVNTGFSDRLNKACKKANTGDYIGFMPEEKYNDKLIDDLNAFEEIEEVEVSSSVASSKFTINKKQTSNAMFFSEYVPEKNTYEFFNNNLLGFKKENQIQPDKGEAFVPISFQTLFNCNLGDKITIETKDGPYSFKIAEFIEEPLIGSSTIGVKMLFINEADLNYLQSVKDEKSIFGFKNLRLFVKDSYEESLLKLSIRLNNKTEVINNSRIMLSIEEANNYTLLFTKIISGILWAFAILLLLIILIIIGHSVGTSIEMDYVPLGILKSQGFTSLQIRLVLLLQYLLAGSLGSIAGIGVSIVVIRLVNRIFIPITGLLNNDNIKLLESLFFIILLLILISIYTFIKTRNITKISPVQAISCGHAPIYFSSRIAFSISKPIPLPLSIRMILKNIAVNTRRYISTIIIMAILAFFCITVTTFKQMSSLDSIGSIYGSFLSDIYISYKEDLNPTIIDEIRSEINHRSRITNEYQMKMRYFTLDGVQHLGYVVDTPETFWKPLKGRKPLYDNEILLTEISSNELNKKIGDTVTVKYGELQEDYLVVGYNQNTSDAGRNFSMLYSGVQRISPEFKYNNVDFCIEDHELSVDIVNYLKQEYKSYGTDLEFVDAYSKVKEETKNIFTALNAITAITYTLVIIFAAIVTFMMCQKAFLRESIDLGILKSVGFTTRDLRGQFTFRYLLVVILGSILGLLANLIWNDALMSTLLRSMGMSHFVTEYSADNILIPLLVISGFTALFSWLVSRRIKSVSPKNLIQE